MGPNPSDNGVRADTDQSQNALASSPSWLWSKRYEFALGLVLLLSFALRFHALGSRGFDSDEIAEILRMRGTDAAFLGWSGPDGFTPIPFLLPALARVIVALGGGEHELTLRFIPFFFAIASVPLVYYIGRRVADRQLGLAASFVVAVNPYLSWYAQYLRPYTMLLFFSTLATALLIKALTDRPRPHLWAAYAASLLLAVTTQWQGALVIVFHEVLYVGVRLRRHASLRWWGVIHGVLAAVLVAAVPLWPMFRRIGEFILNWPWTHPAQDPDLWGAVVGMLTEFSSGSFAPPDFREAASWVAVVLLNVGLVALWKSRVGPTDRGFTIGETLLLLVAWVIVPFGLASLHPKAYHLIHSHRFFIFVLPALCLLMGQGLLALRRISVVLMVQAVLLVLLVSAYSYKDCYAANACGRIDRADYRVIAEYVAANEWPDDSVLAMYSFVGSAFRYLSHGSSSIIAADPHPTDPDEGAPWQTLTRAAFEQSRRVWWLSVSRQEDLAWRLAEMDALVDSYGFRVGEPVATSDDPEDLPVTANLVVSRLDPYWRTEQVEARFGADIVLDEYAIDSVPIVAGDGFRLWLRWHALRPISDDYKTTVRLFDAQHNFVSQIDGVPANWTRPTTSWDADETIDDVYLFPIPYSALPGLYTVRVGLYRPDTMALLPVSGPDITSTGGLLLLGTINYGEYGRTERVEAHFGADIVLEEYATDAVPFVAGDGFRLRLAWHAVRPIGDDYKTTVRLFDAQHNFVSQIDGVPADWTRPTTSWDADETIDDVYVIPIPRSTSPGRYTVEVGLYRSDTMALLPVSGPDITSTGGLLLLGTIDVVARGE